MVIASGGKLQLSAATGIGIDGSLAGTGGSYDNGIHMSGQGGTHGPAEVLHRRDGGPLGEGMGIQGMEAAQGEKQYQGRKTQACPQHPAADPLQCASLV